MATASFVDAASAQGVSPQGGTISVTLPAGIQEGDLLIAGTAFRPENESLFGAQIQPDVDPYTGSFAEGWGFLGAAGRNPFHLSAYDYYLYGSSLNPFAGGYYLGKPEFALNPWTWYRYADGTEASTEIEVGFVAPPADVGSLDRNNRESVAALAAFGVTVFRNAVIVTDPAAYAGGYPYGSAPPPFGSYPYFYYEFPGALLDVGMGHVMITVESDGATLTPPAGWTEAWSEDVTTSGSSAADGITVGVFYRRFTTESGATFGADVGTQKWTTLISEAAEVERSGAPLGILLAADAAAVGVEQGDSGQSHEPAEAPETTGSVPPTSRVVDPPNPPWGDTRDTGDQRRGEM